MSVATRMLKTFLPGVVPFFVGFMIWYLSGLSDGSVVSRLLIVVFLPIMLMLTFMAQKVFDHAERVEEKARWLLPMFVISAFSSSLFFTSGTSRMILALSVIIVLFVALRKGMIATADVVPAVAMATLFFATYSLFAVGSFLEVSRIFLTLGMGVVAGISAHDVFAHFHPKSNIRQLLVLIFAVVAMEFFVVLSLLPSTPLVSAALLSIPLAISLVVIRSMIIAQERQSFLREFILTMTCMLAVIVTARWV